MVKSRAVPRALRASSTARLDPPALRTHERQASRLFSALAPRWWNELPLAVRTAESLTVFERRLKTRLFVMHLSMSAGLGCQVSALALVRAVSELMLVRSGVGCLNMRDSSVNFNFLHRTCTLVVLLCFLHISVTVFYYVRSLDFKQTFVQNQQIQQDQRKLTAYGHGSEEEAKPTTFPHPVLRDPNVTDNPRELEKCPDPSPLLVGPLRIEFSTPVSLEQVRNENPVLQEGGRYKPKDCIALQKVAIIIPFRNRDEHLKFWLYYLHPILQRQQLDYGVYIINQFPDVDGKQSVIQLQAFKPNGAPDRVKSRADTDGNDTFNRAKLLNVGYAEALKEYDYECFVFSDVDLIPMDDRNTYKCFSQPRHLSVSMDKFGFRHVAHTGSASCGSSEPDKLWLTGARQAVAHTGPTSCGSHGLCKLWLTGARQAVTPWGPASCGSPGPDKLWLTRARRAVAHRSPTSCGSHGPRKLLPYNQYFGGVSSMSKEQFLKINGFPNNYWGWGGEDDDIYNRLSSKGMTISRPTGVIGKCRMIRHERDKQNDPNPQRFDRIAHTRETMHKDGIKSLSYKVVKVEKDLLFTKITVDIGKAP
ncbi:hypothetical protein NFI96_029010 [Prochilodus magdalenae]|nr:hypothetical protein NFI96_029010 [Prochilodus magdalenae]